MADFRKRLVLAGIIVITSFPLRHPVITFKVVRYPVRHPVKTIHAIDKVL